MFPDLCVALDVPRLDAALALADRLSPDVSWFKVGLELFSAAGPKAVQELRVRGAKVFLDLKLHDIPETTARATAAAGDLGAELLTVHAVAGEVAIRRAVQVPHRPRLVAVTMLTSDTSTDAAARTLELGQAALAWGVEGLVASPGYATALRQTLGNDFVLVTPGVRPVGTATEDHAQVATPKAAARAGASLLVVGRPIRDAADPLAAARSILAEMRAA